jgi:ABC-type nitrate/sulfonate/bicarbonate transport system permease component
VTAVELDRTTAPEVTDRKVWDIAPGRAEIDPAGHARKVRWQRRLLGILTPVVLLVLWEVAFQVGWIDARFFPGPSRIAESAVEMIRSGQWFSDLGVTLRTIFIGGGGGFLAGALVGTILASFKRLRFALEPTLGALYTIPKLALLPLMLLIFGLGDLPGQLLVGLGIFFISWLTVLEAVLQIPEGYREAASSFGVRRLRAVRHVVLPAILPALFVGLRISIGQAVLIVITIEYLIGDKGIGFRIWHSWSLFAADQMYVGIVTVALLGFVLQSVVQFVGAKVAPWSSGNAARGK